MHLDYLRDSNKQFPWIEETAGITSLRIWYCKYATLTPVANFANLEELVIAGLPDATLSFVKNLGSLRYLRILHLPNLHSLDGLEGLRKLETLSLATSPEWDAKGRIAEVDSLLPIAQLVALQHLELFGICPPTRSLQVIERCPNLKSARFSGYPNEEIERYFKETRKEETFNPKPEFEAKMKGASLKGNRAPNL